MHKRKVVYDQNSVSVKSYRISESSNIISFLIWNFTFDILTKTVQIFVLHPNEFLNSWKQFKKKKLIVCTLCSLEMQQLTYKDLKGAINEPHILSIVNELNISSFVNNRNHYI